MARIDHASLTEHIRGNTFVMSMSTNKRMPEHTLDLRDIPPAERHPLIHESFDELESGEVLTLINDHEPKPLFYEMQAEVEEFDADRYEVEQRDANEFVAILPKKNHS